MSYINSGDVYAIKYEDVLANYIGIRNQDLKTFAKTWECQIVMLLIYLMLLTLLH